VINDGEPLDKDEFIKRLNMQSNSYRDLWLAAKKELDTVNSKVTKIKKVTREWRFKETDFAAWKFAADEIDTILK
jgi:hypothetical protein